MVADKNDLSFAPQVQEDNAVSGSDGVQVQLLSLTSVSALCAVFLAARGRGFLPTSWHNFALLFLLVACFTSLVAAARRVENERGWAVLAFYALILGFLL